MHYFTLGLQNVEKYGEENQRKKCVGLGKNFKVHSTIYIPPEFDFLLRPQKVDLLKSLKFCVGNANTLVDRNKLAAKGGKSIRATKPSFKRLLI